MLFWNTMQLLHSNNDSSSLNLSCIKPAISVLPMPFVEMLNNEDDTFVWSCLERFYCYYLSLLTGNSSGWLCRLACNLKRKFSAGQYSLIRQWKEKRESFCYCFSSFRFLPQMAIKVLQLLPVESDGIDDSLKSVYIAEHPTFIGGLHHCKVSKS